MSDWPTRLDRPQKIALGTWALQSGAGEIAVGLRPTISAAAWPSANRAIYVPVYVTEPMTVYQLALYNGAVAGEVDVGIYSYTGTGTAATRLASSGKVAMSGATQLQLFNITDQVLLPGIYFLAAVCSTVTTATFFRLSINNVALQAGGVTQQALAETVLGATATMARPEASFAPIIMAIGRSLL